MGRFTAVIGSNGEGDFLPLTLIFKVQCQDPLDLTKSPLLQRIKSKLEAAAAKLPGIWTSGLFECLHPNSKGELVEATISYMQRKLEPYRDRILERTAGDRQAKNTHTVRIIQGLFNEIILDRNN